MKRYISCLAACMLMLPFCAGCGDTGSSTTGSTGSQNTGGTAATTAPAAQTTAAPVTTTAAPAVQQPNIRTAGWQNVQWTTYQDVYFTVEIPVGWQVQWNGDAHQLSWSATNDAEYVGVSNLDHNYAVKDASLMEIAGFNMYLTDGTVEEYFTNSFADSTDYFNVENSCVPSDKDQLQAVRPYDPIRDYQTLYATFAENGLEGEGLYSAVIMDSPDINVGTTNYGVWEINGIFTQWAKRGQLVNWLPVLKHIVESFRYTDFYIQQWIEIAKEPSTSAPTSMNDPDPVLEAFEERDRSDTIIQEKRSDEIEDYERVYDTETGELYRAYEGFLEDAGSDQTRYVAATDDQYAEGYVGWIDP